MLTFLPWARLVFAVFLLSFLTSITYLVISQLDTKTILAMEKDDSVLASREISLDKRQNNQWVNSIFRDNILLNTAYLRSLIKKKGVINWNEIKKPFTYEFTLEPESTFAFHDIVKPEYKGKIAKTTNAHFGASEGFKSDRWLVGDGVCHFASLLFWAAKDAKLDAQAPVNHDFADIPEVPKEYGVSIFASPYKIASSSSQNLYITNNKPHPIVFELVFDGEKLKVTLRKKQTETLALSAN